MSETELIKEVDEKERHQEQRRRNKKFLNKKKGNIIDKKV